jgi:hypothetical protein
VRDEDDEKWLRVAAAGGGDNEMGAGQGGRGIRVRFRGERRGAAAYIAGGDAADRWLGVNTKNWYMKETDLWAEFGKKTPFSRKFSSKHSVKMLADGSTPSFGRRAVLCLEEEAFGNT